MTGLADLAVILPSGELDLRQPREAAELPDDGEVKWAPVVPYWSVLWRSGVALAREFGSARLDGVGVVELGCGLGVPSLAAARLGASALATDEDSDALELLQSNAIRNGIDLETAQVDWRRPADLLACAPFELVLAADVLYEDAAIAPLLDLMPRLARRALVADPGRAPAAAFLDGAESRGRVSRTERGVVRIHAIEWRAEGR